MRKGQRILASVTSLDGDGRGVADLGGVELHVPGLLPGEAGEVAITHRSPHRPIAFGALVARRGAASADRVEPACPGHGRCGGCALQSLRYPAQLEAKRRRVALALGATVDAVPTPIAAPAELGYRNRGIYVIGELGGKLALGAYAPGTHQLVDTLGCQVVAPPIDELARRARELLLASALPYYREQTQRGCLRYLVVRASRAGQALVALVTTADTPRPRLEAVADGLMQDPRVVGVVWVRNDTTAGAVLTDDQELLRGVATLRETIGGVPVDLAIGAFTQVHLDAAERLYDDLATRAAVHAEYAIDLYSGVGAIAFALARRGLQVIGVERNPRAVDAAWAAAAAAGLGARARFVAGEAADLGGALKDEPADLVVVNPPRKGLDDSTRGALLARRPPAIAYVSCEPTTLARDLEAFAAVGYRIAWLQPYDLMPGAGPIEIAVLLVR